MRFQNTLALLSAVAVGVSAQDDEPKTGDLGDATVVDNNPIGAHYTATLPDEAFTKSAYPDGGNAKGYIEAVTNDGGQGVSFKVRFENLPKEGGPFTYHLHKAAVPGNGNCNDTLTHLDPFQRGDTPPCVKAQPQTCEVGDLSGKHGKIESDPFEAEYVDLYASTLEGNPAYFGDLSFVLHFANKTRISCANFVQISAGTPSDDKDNYTTVTTQVPVGTGTGAPTAEPTATDTDAPIAGASLVSKSTAMLSAGAASLLAIAFML